MKMATADFLRGEIEISRGNVADYRGLAHLHYVPGDPATFAGVWRAEYRDGLLSVDCGLSKGRERLRHQSTFNNPQSRVVAVAVLSYPTLALRARERTLGLGGMRSRERWGWINANLRTVSRVIVHPQFRSLGIASQLVRRVLLDCPTRYVEAVAPMGLVHPFFVRAGMTLEEPRSEEESAYFW